jgi:hypothetical protein
MVLLQITETLDATKPALEKMLTSQPSDPSGSVLITVLFFVAFFEGVIIFFLIKNLIKKPEAQPLIPAADGGKEMMEVRVKLGQIETLIEQGFESLKDILKMLK